MMTTNIVADRKCGISSIWCLFKGRVCVCNKKSTTFYILVCFNSDDVGTDTVTSCVLAYARVYDMTLILESSSRMF